MPVDSLGSTEALIINYLQWWLEHWEVHATEEEKTKKEEELTSNSLLRLIVLSLSVSAVEDWVETLCGA